MPRPKISTGKGDQGWTAILGKERLPKHHIRLEAYGTIDELNAYVGWLRVRTVVDGERLAWIQARLFDLGAWLAASPDLYDRLSLPAFPEAYVRQVEGWTYEWERQLPPLRHFILPGGHEAVALAHVCRTVCRRAERACTALHLEEPLPVPALPFLNRLSDYFFLLARAIARELGIAEEAWRPGTGEAPP